jgi:hypothetical protein
MTTQTKPDTTHSLLDVAQRYIDAGFLVLPASSATKYPTLSSYRQYRDKPPTEKQNESWFTPAKAICILTGAVSGNLEVLDFDQGGRAFDEWCDKIAHHKGRLLQRIVVQKSQSGGRHVFFRNELITPRQAARCWLERSQPTRAARIR